jgi:hypothetical protein
MKKEPQPNPLLEALPLVERVARQWGAIVRVVRVLGDARMLAVECTNGTHLSVVAVGQSGAEVVGHRDADGRWVPLGDGAKLLEAIGYASVSCGVGRG